MNLVDIPAKHGLQRDVMKGDVAEAEVEALASERQLSEPVDFGEMHLWQVREPLAASANHFARDVHSENMPEVTGKRFKEPACSAADLQGAIVCWKNFRNAFQHQPKITLARGPEDGFVVRFI